MRLFILALIVVLLAPVTSLAKVKIKPGLWEFASKVEMVGLPVTMPATRFKQCLTEADMIPITPQDAEANTNNQCEVLYKNIEQDTITWETVCTNAQGDLNIKGKMVYKGDKMKGVVKTRGVGINGVMSQNIRGRRIGKCN